MKDRYLLILKAEDAQSPIRNETFDEDERLDVRDLTGSGNTQVRAKELSPYRHTLFLDGKAYSILEVMKRFRSN